LDGTCRKGDALAEEAMKRWKGLLLLVGVAALSTGGSLLCVGGALAAGLFGIYPQPIRDALDRRLLLRHFDLPAGLRLVEYDGYPAMVGLGQREGLHIRAVYRMPERRAEAFEGHFLDRGWLPLPMPAETRDRIRPYVEGETLALSSGWYLCRTAGNDVLHARKIRPCAEVDRLGDAILGVYDRGSRRLTLQVGSGY
jgi:hypothetical protein